MKQKPGVLERRRNRIFMARSLSAYKTADRSHNLANLPPMPLTVEEFRAWLRGIIGQPCPYCQQVITVRNFSLDHCVPLSRGGGSDPSNMGICCMPCNRSKGNFTVLEYNALLKELSLLSHRFDNPNIKRHVLMSLKIASSFRFGRDRKKKAARAVA